MTQQFLRQGIFNKIDWSRLTYSESQQVNLLYEANVIT